VGRKVKNQIAPHFANQTPQCLQEGGIDCLIQPATTLVNLHGSLDGDWFRAVTVEKIVQLSDYPALEFEAKVGPFENGREFSLRVLRAGNRVRVGKLMFWLGFMLPLLVRPRRP
jgi:hypothetical protein